MIKFDLSEFLLVNQFRAGFDKYDDVLGLTMMIDENAILNFFSFFVTKLSSVLACIFILLYICFKYMQDSS